MTVSIVLADDHPLVRSGLQAAFEKIPEFTVVAATGDGLEAVTLVETLKPDVLVLDIQMPGLSGLDVLPIVRRGSPRTQVVVLSMYANEGFVLQALTHGAVAYVVKSADPEHAVEAVRHAAQGRRYLSPGISERAVEAFAQKAAAQPPAPHDLLTPRERQVIQLVAEGHANPRIADRLIISPRTVEMHRANAMRKLGLKSQTELIRYALSRGMISPHA